MSVASWGAGRAELARGAIAGAESHGTSRNDAAGFVADLQNTLTPQQRESLRTTFEHVDGTQDGTLQPFEFSRALVSAGFAVPAEQSKLLAVARARNLLGKGGGGQMRIDYRGFLRTIAPPDKENRRGAAGRRRRKAGAGPLGVDQRSSVMGERTRKVKQTTVRTRLPVSTVREPPRASASSVHERSGRSSNKSQQRGGGGGNRSLSRAEAGAEARGSPFVNAGEDGPIRTSIRTESEAPGVKTQPSRALQSAGRKQQLGNPAAPKGSGGRRNQPSDPAAHTTGEFFREDAGSQVGINLGQNNGGLAMEPAPPNVEDVAALDGADVNGLVTALENALRQGCSDGGTVNYATKNLMAYAFDTERDFDDGKHLAELDAATAANVVKLQAAGKKGAVAALIAVMGRHDSVDVLLWCAMALRNLADTSDSRAAVVEHGGVPALVKVIRQTRGMPRDMFQWEVEILKWCAESIRNATDVGDGLLGDTLGSHAQQQLLDCGGIEVVIEAMHGLRLDRHPEEPDYVPPNMNVRAVWQCLFMLRCLAFGGSAPPDPYFVRQQSLMQPKEEKDKSGKITKTTMEYYIPKEKQYKFKAKLEISDEVRTRICSAGGLVAAQDAKKEYGEYDQAITSLADDLLETMLDPVTFASTLRLRSLAFDQAIVTLSKLNHPKKRRRSTTCIIRNNSDYVFRLEKAHLRHGTWSVEPPAQIVPNEVEVPFGAGYGVGGPPATFMGVQGTVVYVAYVDTPYLRPERGPDVPWKGAEQFTAILTIEFKNIKFNGELLLDWDAHCTAPLAVDGTLLKDDRNVDVLRGSFNETHNGLKLEVGKGKGRDWDEEHYGFEVPEGMGRVITPERHRRDSAGGASARSSNFSDASGVSAIRRDLVELTEGDRSGAIGDQLRRKLADAEADLKAEQKRMEQDFKTYKYDGRADLEAEEVNVFSGFSLADLQAGDGVFNADLGCGGSDRESRLTSSEPAQREAAPSGVAPSEAGSQDVGV